ncbi:MAG: hypothetical protein U0237_17125 [Thermoleophilia bacterium]
MKRQLWAALGAGVALVGCVQAATAAWGPPATVFDAGTGGPVTQAQAAGLGVDVIAGRAGGRVFVATRNSGGFAVTILRGAPAQGRLVVAARGRRAAIGIAGPAGVTIFDTADAGGRWRRSTFASSEVATGLNLAFTVDGALRAAFSTPAGTVVASPVRRGAWTTQGVFPAGASSPILGAQPYGRTTVLVANTQAGLTGALSQGQAFSGPSTILSTDDGTVVAGFAAAVRPTGGPVLAATIRETPGGRPSVVAIRGTLSNTWEEVPDSVSLPGAHVVAEAPVLTPRLSANTVVAWREESAGKRRIVASVEMLSAAGGWRRPVVITPFGPTTGGPVLATAPGGRVLIAYATGGGIFVRQLGGMSGAYVWSRPTRLNGSLTGCAAPSISFGPANRATVSYACGGRLVASSERG